MVAREQLIDYWSKRFKISPDTFDSQGVSFFARSHLNKYQKIIVFQTINHSFVFYPDIFLDSCSQNRDFHKFIDFKSLKRCFPTLSIEQRGTDFYFYWMLNPPELTNQNNLRLLHSSDKAAIKNLQQDVTPLERQLGEVNLEHSVVLGWFSPDNRLLCVGSLIIEKNLADIGILTHPNARNQGLGKYVVQALIVEGLRMNKLVQYTSMEKNFASVALAKSLGFEQFARETYYGIN